MRWGQVASLRGFGRGQFSRFFFFFLGGGLRSSKSKNDKDVYTTYVFFCVSLCLDWFGVARIHLKSVFEESHVPRYHVALFELNYSQNITKLSLSSYSSVYDSSPFFYQKPVGFTQFISLGLDHGFC